MAVNLKKVAKDIFHPEEDIRILALTTVVQLVSLSIDSVDDLDHLATQLEKATALEDTDMVFLARKGLNHVRELRGQLEGAAPRKERGPQGKAKRSREDILQELNETHDVSQIATGLRELSRAGKAEDVPLVRPFLRHTDARVRGNAVEAIENLADERVMTEVLAPFLTDDNNRVRGNVAKALGRIGYSNIVAIIKEMKSSSKLSMRESATYAMSFIKGPEMVEMLFDCLRDPYEGIRFRAVQGLARHKDPRAVGALKPLLNDIDINICEEAERAIQFIAAEEAVIFKPEMVDLGQAPRGEAREVAFTPQADGGGLSMEDRDRLSTKLKAELAILGRHVFDLIRTNKLADASLKKPFYDVLKLNEFLKKHEQRLAQIQGDDQSGSTSSADRQEARRNLEAKISLAYGHLGQKTVELLRSGAIDFSGGKEQLMRISEIEARLS